MERQLVIVGAGPAGLQLAVNLKRGGIARRILERGPTVGTFFRKFPRHRKLISINKANTGFDNGELNLRWDWHSLLDDGEPCRFTKMSSSYFPDAEEYVRYLEEYRARNCLDVEVDTNVTSISRRREGFCLSCEGGRTVAADDVIIATGLVPRRPAFPGNDLIEYYADMNTDASSFVGQRVLIIGKGNSAFETAGHLINSAAAIYMLSPSPVRLAWTTKYVGNVRSENAGFLDTCSLRSQNDLIEGAIDRIEGRAGQLCVQFRSGPTLDKLHSIFVDRVLACTGFAFDTTIFSPECAPASCHEGRFPLLTAAWESINVPGLFFAGCLMHGRDFRAGASGFIHGFRHNVRALARILELRQGVPWKPTEEFPSTKQLCNAVLKRINTGASLFQQPGTFSDVFVFDASSQRWLIFQDMPREYFADYFNFRGPYYTLTLEHSNAYPESGERVRPPHVASGDPVCPVVRRMLDHCAVAEHHLSHGVSGSDSSKLNDVLAEWLEGDLNRTDVVRTHSPVFAQLRRTI